MAGTYPHAFKKDDGEWDGIDIRFLSLLSEKKNFKANVVAYSSTKKAYKLVIKILAWTIGWVTYVDAQNLM